MSVATRDNKGWDGIGHSVGGPTMTFGVEQHGDASGRVDTVRMSIYNHHENEGMAVKLNRHETENLLRVLTDVLASTRPIGAPR